jgi:putative copper export protein/mono/diheme cytochrome c family protein
MSTLLAGCSIAGGLPLAVARGLFVAALLGVFGTLLFAAAVAPRALARADPGIATRVDTHLTRLAVVQLAAALLLASVWLVAQAADMAGAASLGPALAAVPTVLTRTEFGRVLLTQALCLAAAAAALIRARGRRQTWPALAFSGLATTVQAMHGHAWAMYDGPSLLLAAGAMHLLAAGGWLGGLIPLLAVVRTAPEQIGAAAARWFSPLGKWCVGGIAVSATWQFWILIGGLPGLIGTAYGWIALLKLGLLGVLLGFAVVNRYQLAPALLGDAPNRAKRVLAGSIAVQTGFGLVVVLAAAVLSSLPPAMHVQPWWPFAWRFSLVTVQEDADFRREVIGAALALAGAAVAAVVLIALHRRVRWLMFPGLAACIAIAAAAIPHLDLLLVAAYPTSFYHAPTGFSAASIARGAALYPQHCASCHGPDGHGDGPAAAALAIPPADLTAAHLWMHSDGELFWWLTQGIRAPAGGLAMPGFAHVLSDGERWSLIDYIRAYNAGLVWRAARAWSPPLHAPTLDATCADGGSVSLEQVRGKFVRLVFAAVPPPPVAGVTTILAGAGPPPSGSVCVARDPAVARANAIVAGVAPAQLGGMQFLIDGDGWLRAAQARDGAAAWNDPTTLQATVARLRAHPIAPGGAMDSSPMRM